MSRAFALAVLAAALAACGQTDRPPPDVQVTTVARPVAPVYASECFAPADPRPVLAGGRARQVAATLTAYSRALRRSEALREVCKRSLAAQS